MQSLSIAASLLGGALLAVQAGANTQLSKASGSPQTATALQLGIGALLLFLASLTTGSLAALALLPGVPFWHALGGLASALYVLSTIILFPAFGAVVSVGLLIAGQMLASLLIDGWGWFGVPARGFSLASMAGAMAVLGGVAAIVRGQGQQEGAKAVLRRPGLAVLALFAGALLPIQGAVNALLRSEIQAAWAVGLVSFTVATMAMLLVVSMQLARKKAPVPRAAGFRGMPWWGWLGGVAGAAYVTAVFTSIPAVGTATVVALTVTGQQLASMAVDRFGLLRFPRRAIGTTRCLGVVALLAGVMLIKVA